MDMNYFVFDGVRSDIYKTFISGDEQYNVPEMEYEMFSIPGRNGDIAIPKGRFQNIEVKYPGMIFANTSEEFDENLSNLINALRSKTGYKRLETTYRPEEYRMAIAKDQIHVKPDLGGLVGEFDLVFDCKPQRYLKVGEIARTYTVAGQINNPTLFPSSPLIAVTGTGTVGIGDETITITGDSTQTVYIDCEMMDCYEISGSSISNANSKVSFTGTDFPVLLAGSNGISLGSGISEVVITPHWWRI